MGAWGGVREGAGRKKSSGAQKKMRGFRLTDAEWEYMKSALKKHRKGDDEVVRVSIDSKADKIKPTEFSGLGAGLLAHLEVLYKEDLKWLKEYESYLTKENYEKYPIEKIKLHRKLISIQVTALIPHLLELNFDYEVKRTLAPDYSTNFAGVEIVSWKIPSKINYDETNKKLISLLHERDKLSRKILKLKKEEWG